MVLSVGQGPVHGRLAVVGLYVLYVHLSLIDILPTFPPISVDGSLAGGFVIVSVNGAGPGICGLSYIKCVSQDEQKHVDPVGFLIVTRPFWISRVR